MDNNIKNRNLLVIVFELLVIALGIIGITFATTKMLNSSAKTTIKTGEYSVDYKGDTAISIKDIEPISDDLVNYNTKENVIRIEFSLKGTKIEDNENLIYDVMLSDMNIDCSLLNKYTKWNLYKNGTLLSNGSFDPFFDGNVLTDSMKLTNRPEDLPKSNDSYDDYVLIFWISESCTDLSSCELIDQSNILDSNMSMKVFIAIFSGDKVDYKRVPNYDGTCANKPELYNNMIPVIYSNGEWVVSDKENSNENNLWYSYKNGRWANSVIVNNLNKYKNVGTVVDNNDVLGYYVWIPRFRYKLWNVDANVTDSYNAYDNGIDIVFENGLNSISNNENNKYVTHPVFGDKLKGFWISKYELSKDNDIYKSIPNVESYRNDTLDNYQNVCRNLIDDYRFENGVETHMVNNLEWGSTLYLSHSVYGVCAGDGCSSIGMNDTYISGNNKQDTTTRNVYGVYDMAGGASEYVIGKSNLGSATSEVVLDSKDTWYNGHGMVSDRDYIIRGGKDRGLFYFGDINMSTTEYGTRSSIVKINN